MTRSPLNPCCGYKICRCADKLKEMFTRIIYPFDIELTFDLYDVITKSFSECHWEDIKELADLIKNNQISLSVMYLRHYIPENLWHFLDDPMYYQFIGTGISFHHHKLCTLAKFYLEALNKRTNTSGSASCCYAGGWADVIAVDKSIYIECGTLRSNKPLQAFKAKQTLMIIPYEFKLDLSPENINKITHLTENYFDDLIEKLRKVQPTFEFTERDKYVYKQEAITLGFQFDPINYV